MAPTTAFPTAPSVEPTVSPTLYPTPGAHAAADLADAGADHASLEGILDAVGFNASDFDAVLTLSDAVKFERAVWMDEEAPQDRNLYHTSSGWILNDKGDAELAYADSDCWPDANAT